MPNPSNSDNYNVNKILSTKQLNQLIENPPKEYIQDNGILILEGFTVIDNHINFNEVINWKYRIYFRKCIFESPNFMSISYVKSKGSINFHDCKFPSFVLINDGGFEDGIVIDQMETESLFLTRLNFNKAVISNSTIGYVYIQGCKFENLNLGAPSDSKDLKENKVKKLDIYSKEGETGNISISGQEFEKILLKGSNRDKEITFQNIKSNSITIKNFTNNGSLKFYEVTPKINENGYFQIINSNLGQAQFFKALFSNFQELIIIDSFITDCLFISCSWSNNIRALIGPRNIENQNSLKIERKITPKEIVGIKEAYRQLKISMSKHSDKIEELKFYSQELTFHNKTLSWVKPWKNQFWDKAILFFSRTFSDYGQSFVKPLFWLIFGHYILFSIAFFNNGFYPLQISFSEPTNIGFKNAFEYFFIYINPLRSMEISFSGYLIVIDFLMRIWSSYMIYSLIRASRRFIS